MGPTPEYVTIHILQNSACVLLLPVMLRYARLSISVRLGTLTAITQPWVLPSDTLNVPLSLPYPHNATPDCCLPTLDFGFIHSLIFSRSLTTNRSNQCSTRNRHCFIWNNICHLWISIVSLTIPFLQKQPQDVIEKYSILLRTNPAVFFETYAPHSPSSAYNWWKR